MTPIASEFGNNNNERPVKITKISENKHESLVRKMTDDRRHQTVKLYNDYNLREDGGLNRRDGPPSKCILKISDGGNVL